MTMFLPLTSLVTCSQFMFTLETNRAPPPLSDVFAGMSSYVSAGSCPCCTCLYPMTGLTDILTGAMNSSADIKRTAANVMTVRHSAKYNAHLEQQHTLTRPFSFACRWCTTAAAWTPPFWCPKRAGGTACRWVQRGMRALLMQ